MLLIELLVGAAVGVWLRHLYFEYVFDAYPAARLALWGLLPPLAAGILLALLLEGALRLVSRKRRSHGLLDRGLGSSLLFSTVIQVEAAKIGAEFGQPLLTIPVLPALVSMALAWMWVQYRMNACPPTGPREDALSTWSVSQARPTRRSPRRPTRRAQS